jgi:hypothetical protein
VRVVRQDERRGGVLTVRRRRLTAGGVQPVGLLQHPFACCSIDGAVAPTTGERLFLAWPSLKADMCHSCVNALAHAFPDRLNLVRLAHSGAQTASRMHGPDHGRAVWLPPDCPELNPMARVWRDVKDDLAWQPWVSLEAQPDFVADVLQTSAARTLPSLTGSTSLVEAMNALGS